MTAAQLAAVQDYLPATGLPLCTMPGQQGCVTVTSKRGPALPIHYTTATLADMRAKAERGARSPIVQRATREATQGSATDDGKAEGIFWYVKNLMSFREDPSFDELVRSPELILSMAHPEGDCDDFSTLAASMMLAAGLRPTFETIKADPKEPTRYSHVYNRAGLSDGRSIAMDTSHGARPGWEAGVSDGHPIYGHASWPMFGMGDLISEAQALLGEPYQQAYSQVSGAINAAPAWLIVAGIVGLALAFGDA